MIDFLQWPALVLSVIGAWLVGGSTMTHRRRGFLFFLLSNGLWMLWAGGIEAWGVVITQAVFTWTSIRGLCANLHDRN